MFVVAVVVVVVAVVTVAAVVAAVAVVESELVAGFGALGAGTTGRGSVLIRR